MMENNNNAAAHLRECESRPESLDFGIADGHVGSTKQGLPLLLRTDDNRVDNADVPAAIKEVVRHGIHLDKGVADCPFCEEIAADEAELDTAKTIKELSTLYGLDAEAELANILSQEIQKMPSAHNLQVLKWYFTDAMVDHEEAKLEIEYQMGGTRVSMQLDGIQLVTNFERPVDAPMNGKITYENRLDQLKVQMRSPGICVSEPCPYVEGWAEIGEGESHEAFHKRTREIASKEPDLLAKYVQGKISREFYEKFSQG